MKERENKRDDGAGRYRWRNSKWTAFYGALSQLGIQCLAQGRFSMTLLYPLSHWHLLTGWRLGACKDSWSHIACIICGVSARMTQSSQPSGESEQKTRTDGALIFFVKVCFFFYFIHIKDVESVPPFLVVPPFHSYCISFQSLLGNPDGSRCLLIVLRWRRRDGERFPSAPTQTRRKSKKSSPGETLSSNFRRFS